MPARSKRHAGGAGFSRRDRVNEQVRRELAELIDRELKDPRIRLVSLTAVELTPDYAHARVWFSSLAQAAEIPEIQRGLEQAAVFLRRELGRRMRIHTIPELRFIHDDSLLRGAELTRLINQANQLHAADATLPATPPATPTDDD